MSSSASTANSTDEVMKGPDDVDEEDAGEVKEPSPFDRLPDEVVLEILGHAVDPHGYGPMVSLQELLVNKRLYDLGAQVASLALSYREDPFEVAARRPHRAQTVEILNYSPSCFNEQAQHLEGLLLGAFRNLTTLAVHLYEDEEPIAETVIFPIAFARSLIQLEHLESLRFSGSSSSPFKFEDDTFCIANDLPQLRRLSLRAPCSALRQLLAPSPTLEHLYLSTQPASDAVYDLIPWSSLVSLSLDLGKSDSLRRPLDQVTESLKAVLSAQFSCAPAELPLRQLNLANGLDRPLPPPLDSIHLVRHDELGRFFRALGSTSIEQLRFEGSVALRCPGPLPSIPSVKVLILHWEWTNEIARAPELVSLHHFLASFPSLEHLDLDFFGNILPDRDRARDAFHPASLEFRMRHPFVCCLLDMLRHSTVLSLRWDAGSASYRWTRSKPEEEFEVERYKHF